MDTIKLHSTGFQSQSSRAPNETSGFSLLQLLRLAFDNSLFCSFAAMGSRAVLTGVLAAACLWISAVYAGESDVGSQS